jgi:hypothetical protein
MLPDSIICGYSGPLINKPLLLGRYLGFTGIVVLLLHAFVFLVWERFLRSEVGPSSNIEEFGEIRFRHLFYGNEILVADIDGPVILFRSTAELPIIHMRIWACAVICSLEFPRLLLPDIIGVVGNPHNVSPGLQRIGDLKA